MDRAMTSLRKVVLAGAADVRKAVGADRCPMEVLMAMAMQKMLMIGAVGHLHHDFIFTRGSNPSLWRDPIRASGSGGAGDISEEEAV